MKERWSALAVAVSVTCMGLPGPAVGQAIGIGARAGTLGLGGEVAVGLTDRIVLRGGMGLVPFEPNATLGDIDVTLALPDWYNAGVDLYLTGAMRLGGGILFKSDDPSLSGDFTAPQRIGTRTYTPSEIGTLVGVFDSSDRVPYALIGFGRHTASGFGLFLDLGVGFLGEPDIRLDARGGSLDPNSNAQFRQALDDEAAEFEADVGTYLKLWPILSIGVRLGLG
jgi:hypothetical protein